MNCEKIQQDILLSQTGELTARELARLEKHIAGCDSCRRYKAGMEQVMSAAKSELPAGEPGSAVMARILSAAREEVSSGAISFPAPSLRASLYAAAALFIVCAIGLWSFNFRPLSSASQVSAIRKRAMFRMVYKVTWFRNSVNIVIESVTIECVMCIT